MTTKKAKTEIIKAYPDFEITNITYLAEGMDSIVFLVNSNYVFRFAKRKESSGLGGGFDTEIKLLPFLREKLQISIPNFEYIYKKNGGVPFVGYKKIEGNELTAKILNELSEEERFCVFEEIANFFNTMHSLTIDKLQSYDMKVVDFKSRYTKNSKDIDDYLTDLMKKSELDYLHNLLDSYLSDEDNFIYTPVLLHADLWLSHILFNQKKKKISGIIDFGDMIIGDPDYDFMQIYQGYGEKSLEYFNKLIPDFNLERVRKKSLFFQKWNVVRDLVFFKKLGNNDGIEWALKEIRSFLN